MANAIDVLDSPELMEKLAEIEHDRWSGQARTALDDLTPERRERWTRFAATPYAELDEEIKELDRMQVRGYLPAIRAALVAAVADQPAACKDGGANGS